MAKLIQIEVAQKFALKGDIKSALAELSALQARGDVAASAALAEIAAYKGKWQDVLKYIKVVFATPSALDTFNVYHDMVMLVARAGLELNNWSDIENLAKLALSNLKNIEDNQSHVEAVRDLINFAGRKGKGPYITETETEEKRKKKFEDGLDRLVKKKKKFKKKSDRLNHLYGLARVRRYYPGAVALYDEENDLPDIFENVTFVASALARCGRKKEAWQVIKSRLNCWWPVEDSQIAPVELLTDEGIKPLMSQNRCQEVLRTPRGPEAN